VEHKTTKKEGDAGGFATQSSPESLSHDTIKLLLKDIIQKYNISHEDLSEAFSQESSNDIPISIFNNETLSALEAITKYLHEDRKLKFSHIASLLNRDARTIWSSYQAAKKKHPLGLPVKHSDMKIPLHQFTDRSLSILESLVSYLKENFSLSLHDIASLLNRDDRTIWTVYNRYKKKVMTHA